MRIQHNITALNAHRNLTTNNSAVTKNLEKLSSGYRINRAGDDAAGLAISEKMRAQITGLETAQKNAEDGVSLVQTAEGALTEVHSMLNRMVELATQSANGTYSESNRAEMQKEINALRDEIDRIGNTANFNGTKLFGADATTYTATGKINGADIQGTQQQGTQNVYTTGAWTDVTNGSTDAKFSFTVLDEEGTQHTFDVAIDTTTNKNIDQVIAALNNDDTLKSYGITLTKDNNTIKFTSDDTGSDAAHVTNVTFDKGTGNNADGALAGGALVAGKDAGMAYDLQNMKDGDSITVNGKTYTYKQGANGDNGEFADFDTLKTALDKDGMAISGTQDAAVFKQKPGVDKTTTINLHVGEASDKANTIQVSIKEMNSKSLGIKDLDISTAEGAKKAIDTINTAIDTVSSIRSDLGALQNRLEHTINNLGVQNENITAAESRIRDVDMAKEMMAYTKNNILVQSSQAMLAQANQVPQGVLQLLQ